LGRRKKQKRKGKRHQKQASTISKFKDTVDAVVALSQEFDDNVVAAAGEKIEQQTIVTAVDKFSGKLYLNVCFQFLKLIILFYFKIILCYFFFRRQSAFQIFAIILPETEAVFPDLVIPDYEEYQEQYGIVLMFIV